MRRIFPPWRNFLVPGELFAGGTVAVWCAGLPGGTVSRALQGAESIFSATTKRIFPLPRGRNAYKCRRFSGCKNGCGKRKGHACFWFKQERPDGRLKNRFFAPPWCPTKIPSVAKTLPLGERVLLLPQNCFRAVRRPASGKVPHRGLRSP